MAEPLTKDEIQVQKDQEKTIRERKSDLRELKEVLSTLAGRRVIWRLLNHCKVFESIWDNSARIHKNAGRQDVGHFLMSEVESADQNALFTMMKEAKEAKGGIQCQ